MSDFFDSKVEEMLKYNNSLDNGKYTRFYEVVLPRIKDHVEELWSKYENYSPKGFKENACKSKETFYQRWWEMYFGFKLLDWGFTKINNGNKKDKGPDFKITVNNKKYWIETVAPEIGTNENKLPIIQDGVHDLPREEFILRLLNSMDNKIKKFKKYIDNKIVKEDDVKIIAISTCNLSQYGDLMDFPELAIESLLYNWGEEIINLKNGNKWLSSKNGINVKSREGMKNISTNIFKENCSIDGVIYTHDEPLNRYNRFYLRESPNSRICNDFRKIFINN